MKKEANRTFIQLLTRKVVIRSTALVLFLVMMLLQPFVTFCEYDVKAAAKKTLYIGEAKLFIKEEGTVEDAQKWCDAQKENKDTDEDNDWHCVNGDLNLYAQSGFKLPVGVFFCYRTTSDAKDAITDLAVMNEKGNYDEGAYEILLKEQQDIYADMVADMKDMLEEYRANYNKEEPLPSAVQVHDFLNRYVEDDSGKLLGDLLLEINDTDLANVLLQANGEIVMVIQQQLAIACDTGKKTWLDRMEQLGSYANLRKQYLKAYNNNAAKADKAMKVKYHDKALKLLDNWEDIKVHMDHCKEFVKEYGLDKMTEAQRKKWFEDNTAEIDSVVYEQECTTLELLTAYKYEGETLYEYFMTPLEEVSGNNITKVYPLVASLTDGQRAGLAETVTLYQMIQTAAVQTLENDYDAGKDKEFDNEKYSKEDEQQIEDEKESLAETLETWNDAEKISIYEGVDREIFTDGVAVTSLAENYGKGSDTYWADAFVDSGDYWKTTVGLLAGSVTLGFAAFICGRMATNFLISVGEDVFLLNQGSQFVRGGITGATHNICNEVRDFDTLLSGTRYGFHTTKETCREAVDDLVVNGLKVDNNLLKFNIIKGFKIGLTVFAIALAVADIVMTIITLYNYYNRDHLPIPHHMVDLTYNEDHETSYIAYKSVLDNSGNYGDVNGGSGKQWLALYATKDPDAGDPIIAPTEDNNAILVAKGSEGKKTPMGYSPLHYFGTPASPQNLTFADGENGWSYNDDAGGVYMYFTRDPNAFYALDDDSEGENENETETETETASVETPNNSFNNGANNEGFNTGDNMAAATTMSTGGIAALSVGGVVLGALLGIGGSALYAKRKKKSNKAQ